MSESIKAIVKLQLKAGQANPSPPIGPALGSHGINLNEFCTDFNKKSLLTNNTNIGDIVSVVVTIFTNKTFETTIKTPPTSVLLKKELQLKLGSVSPKKVVVGIATEDILYKIAELKSKDLTAATIEAAAKTIAGTAKSMGISIKWNTKTD